ncbi:MAG TPA: arginyltransferase [Gammaproteobacteria bacterium]|nr:arginyltransferase [Gammaproteobacteria bacterium]
MKAGKDTPVNLDSLHFYATVPHACSYLPEREATTLFADPSARMNNMLYSQLSALGFRRSGEHIYRPHCATCRACKPLRIPVERFQPDRSQRRNLRRNADLTTRARPVRFEDEHYALYRRYIRARHPGGGMDQDSPEHYMSFITSPWSDTRLHEFRDAGRLLGVAVTDHLVNGLSAVYTFFDPDLPRRALGTYAVLWQIQHARVLGRKWLYLGYWIEETPKMAYKRRFRPAEYFDGHDWVALEEDGTR